MGREVIVSSGDALRMVSLENGREMQRIPLERAGALCISESQIYCACGDAIWRLDRRYLTPTGLFCGGPDMCSLMISGDGTRLFALCGEADSVLMLSAETGEPLLLNRAGVNPREMALDGEMLAVAGGESGLVLMLCARSLHVLDAISMPGPVYSVAMNQKRIHALCMTPRLSSLLVTLGMGGGSSIVPLHGMPGRLLLLADALYAATYGWLYRLAPDGEKILRRSPAPGKAAWLAGD